MKKLILFLCVCFFVVGVTPAFTMTINVWEVTSSEFEALTEGKLRMKTSRRSIVG